MWARTIEILCSMLSTQIVIEFFQTSNIKLKTKTKSLCMEKYDGIRPYGAVNTTGILSSRKFLQGMRYQLLEATAGIAIYSRTQ